MIEINHPQGSPEWKAHRKTTRNASDYPSAQGLSKKFTRTELIASVATGIEREFSPFMEKILENGHRVELMARPLAEKIIGEELFQIVATTDDGYLGASSDGATMLCDTGWECKQWNAELAESVKQGVVPETHVGQLDQQGEVFGFERILFMVTDGTPDNCVYCWHVPSAEAKAAIRPTWQQFDKDVLAYVPSEIKEMPKADVTIDLPALFVHAKGEITTHNMDEFGKALAAKLAETRAIVLVTDQDFSNAKAAAAKFRETAKAIILSKAQMLAQTETIGVAALKMDAWAEDLNKTALQMEKDVEREDKAKKDAMVLGGKSAYIEHVAALEVEIAPIRLNLTAPNFADAIKGKRNYASMQDAIDTMLAGAKVNADCVAKDVRSKLEWLKEHAAGRSALFPDLQQIIAKPMDDFTLTITSRIDKAKADEAAQLEAEREKIRAEEQAKAEAAAVAKVAEQARISKAEADAQAAAEQAERNRIAAEEICRIDAGRKVQPAVEMFEAIGVTVVDATPSAVLADNPVVDAKAREFIDPLPAEQTAGSTLKLGDICGRLGFTVNADFLASLGVHPVATEKNAKLYAEAKFQTICRLISDHVMALAFKKAGVNSPHCKRPD